MLPIDRANIEKSIMISYPTIAIYSYLFESYDTQGEFVPHDIRGYLTRFIPGNDYINEKRIPQNAELHDFRIMERRMDGTEIYKGQSLLFVDLLLNIARKEYFSHINREGYAMIYEEGLMLQQAPLFQVKERAHFDINKTYSLEALLKFEKIVIGNAETSNTPKH